MNKLAVIIEVSGRVQGVGFRYQTQKKAIELGISGFVQNRPDGSVYIEAEAESEVLIEFVHWCRKGPQWARVTGFNVTDSLALGYTDFAIK